MSFLVVAASLLARLGDFDLPNDLGSFHNERAPLGATVTGRDFTLFSSNLRIVAGTSYSFTGYAFAEGRLHHGRHDLAPFADLPRAIDDAEGVFALVSVGPDASYVRVRPDVLGQFPVFYWYRDRAFLISDNPGMIARVLRHLGLGGEPDPLQVALNVTYGSAFGGGSSFRDVRVLPARHEILWDRASGFRLRELVTRAALMQGHHKDYHSALAAITHRLSARSTAIAGAIQPRWHNLVDLSGGVDSRMTLAGLLHAGAAPRFSYFSYGKFPARPDRHVCDMLLRRYQLAAGRHIGGNTTSTYTPAAIMAGGIARYFGLKPGNFADYGSVEIADYCRLTGFCGEHTQAWGTPLQHTALKVETGAEVAARQAAGYTPEDSMLTADGLAEVRTTLTAYFDELVADVGSRLLNQFTYVENRSRFHFGLASAIANKVRISLDPLLDREVLAAARHVTHWQQKTNRIAYDIIQMLGGTALAQHPYAEFVWNKGIGIEGYDAYAQSALSVTAATPAQCAEVAGMGTLHVLPKTGRTETVFDENAPPLDPSQPLAMERGVLLHMADAIPRDNAVWALVDRERVIAAARDARPPGELKAANLGRLAASLAYYGGLATAAPVTTSVSARDLLDAAQPA